MKFSIRHADKIVGLFVIMALAILIFVVFMLGRNQRWFAQDNSYKTHFSSANGISPNMAILYKGFTIGHVKSIDLAENDLVEITFSIFEEYTDRVTDGSLVEVSSSPIPGLGGGFNFYPGKGTELIPDGGYIPERNSFEAREYIRRGLADIPQSSDSIGNIINQVNSLLDTINISLSGSKGADQLTLGQTLLNIEHITDSVATLTASLDVQINQILSQVNPILEQLNPVIDMVNPVFAQVNSLLDQLNPVLSNVESITESFVTLAGNLNVQIEQILAQIDPILGQVNPVFAQVNSLLDQINPILSNVETLTGDLTAVTNRIADPSEAVMSLLDAEGEFFTGIETIISSLAGIIVNLESVSDFIPAQLPQIAVILGGLNTSLRTVQDVLVAVANNPLLKGGVPARIETGPGGASPRNLNF